VTVKFELEAFPVPIASQRLSGENSSERTSASPNWWVTASRPAFPEWMTGRAAGEDVTVGEVETVADGRTAMAPSVIVEETGARVGKVKVAVVLSEQEARNRQRIQVIFFIGRSLSMDHQRVLVGPAMT
jgi:hypothetical protein